jgi:hypothetical protein
MRINLISAKSSIYLFAGVCLVWYAVIPFATYLLVLPIDQLTSLAAISILGVGAMLVGWRLRLFSFPSRLEIFVHRGRSFHLFIWTFFIAFFILTLATADSVPIFSAITGADANQLSAERGLFLKGREGPLSSLVFVNTLLVTAFVPYSLACLYYAKDKIFFIVFPIFVFYCISYLVKALFVTAIVPIFYVYMHRNGVSIRAIFKFMLVVLIGLTLMASLAGGSSDPEQSSSGSESSFFDPTFRASSPFGLILWRAVSIPVITASDTLRVHQEEYSGTPLLGRTNGLISFIFRFERIHLEKEVFAAQYGGFNDTANANAFFLTEGYVNFGLLGVIFFGVIAGMTLRFFADSKNVAFSATWPLYALGLFNASFLAMLFSSGFLFFFIYAWCYEWYRARKHRIKTQKPN